MMDAKISVAEFSSLDVFERIRLLDRVYGARAMHLSSMQKTAGVLMHIIYRTRARITILFIDTQFHFPETLSLRERFRERFGLRIRTVKPDLTPEEQRRNYGYELYKYLDGQPTCCYLRKELPLRKAQKRFLSEAVIAGLMRDEEGGRGEIQPIGFDPRIQCSVYHPLFDWDRERVDAYTEKFHLPVHPLYGDSYASIGCAPCTTPVKPGELLRAGRWRHLRTADGKKPNYCNINFGDLTRTSHEPSTAKYVKCPSSLNIERLKR